MIHSTIPQLSGRAGRSKSKEDDELMMERYKKANDGLHAPAELKARAARAGEAPVRRSVWPAAALAAVIFAVACTAILWPREGPGTADDPGIDPLPGNTQAGTDAREQETQAPEDVQTPVYAVPLSAAFEPDYSRPYDGTALDENYLAAIRGFAASAGRELLDGDKTTAYSPTTLYMALSMVAELADGSSRSARLDVLGAESTGELRRYSGDLWRYLCADPDMKEPGKITMANSLWLNGEYRFRTETLKDLADHYYVSGHIGDMQGEIPKLVSDWVKEQTNGLLDCQIEPNEDTMAVLLSAIYFYDQWETQFDKHDVTSGSFRTAKWTKGPAGAKGAYADCMYMERTEEDRAYYRGDGVTASVQYFQNGGKMLFILPDEEKRPGDVLSDPALLTRLLDWEALDKETGKVEWIIPQFTLSDTLDLEDGLTALGLGELFDPLNNALPLLSEDTAAYISEAKQGTAISINEVGCEAASYVEIMVDEAEALIPKANVRMYLTRPFLFAILSENDVPLFLGVVNDPNG